MLSVYSAVPSLLWNTPVVVNYSIYETNGWNVLGVWQLAQQNEEYTSRAQNHSFGCIIPHVTQSKWKSPSANGMREYIIQFLSRGEQKKWKKTRKFYKLLPIFPLHTTHPYVLTSSVSSASHDV